MTKTQSDRENVRITLRLPKELHEKLQKLAIEDERSLNGEIIVLLELVTESKK